MSELDPVTLSIIGHAFRATAEEMGVNLYRSARSTIVREVRDMATAVLDPEGRAVSMGTWVPSLLNAMEPAAQALRKHYNFRELKEDEILLTNDPFDGGQHVNDILLFTPIIVDGEVIGLSGANVHHLDLGGGAPASNSEATEVFQEGIMFPPMKVAIGTSLEETVFGKILRSNIRVPDVTMADFSAQMAACRTGERRIRDLATKYGVETIRQFMVDIQRYSERIIRRNIDDIPDGDYFGEAYMENDGTGENTGPHTVRVTIRVKGSELVADFTGTDEQARGFINSPRASVDTAVRTTIMAIVGANHWLVNAGAFRPITTITPYGTLVNPRWPAATRARTSTCYKIFDAINIALAPVLKDKVTAPGFDCQTGISFAQRKDYKMSVLSEVLGAGVGALSDQDGADGMIMQLTNGMNTPIESVEVEFPFVEVLHYGLRPDSGGPGQYRGGLGMQRHYRVLEDEVNFGLHSDRHQHSAPGLFDGEGGATGGCYVVRDGEERYLGSKVLTTLQAGDVLKVYSGGGAGFGPPKKRDPDFIAQDITEGRMTREAAKEIYGYEETP